jgi:endoglycosylceramidase
MSYDPGSARSIQKIGTWLRDAEGRYVLLRGVNLGGRAKRAPYLPVYPADRADLDVEAFEAELARVRGRLDLLPSLGFNVVRLLVLWKALEPAPLAEGAPLSPEATRYLDCVRALLDALYARGLFAFVDVHQDLAHELFAGDGFPDWAIPDGVSREQEPQSRTWSGRYELDHRVRATLRAFWSNQLEVQDRYAATLGRMAAYLADHPAVLGYEPFNEPHGAGLSVEQFEGSRGWAPGAPASDAAVLPAFYRKAIRAIRAADQEAFVVPRAL